MLSTVVLFGQISIFSSHGELVFKDESCVVKITSKVRGILFQNDMGLWVFLKHFTNHF